MQCPQKRRNVDTINDALPITCFVANTGRHSVNREDGNASSHQPQRIFFLINNKTLISYYLNTLGSQII